MKIIFLDVDGVLNSRAYFESIIDKIKNDKEFSLEHWINIAEVQLLCDWMNKHKDVQICLSSTWRLGWMWDRSSIALNDFFVKNSILITYFTPSPNEIQQPKELYETDGGSEKCVAKGLMFGRSLEIKAWLDQHPEIMDWVAIDDDYFDMKIAQDANRYIQTNFYGDCGGLQPEHLLKVEEILHEKHVD